MTAPAADASTRRIMFTLPLHHAVPPGTPRVAIADGLALVEVGGVPALERTLALPASGEPAASDVIAAARDDLWLTMRALHTVANGVCVVNRVTRTGDETSAATARTTVPSATAPLALADAITPDAIATLRACLGDPARQVLREPLRRLHVSLRRTDDRRRLIDLVTGLSALLLPHYDTDLSLRFSVRGSLLLGTGLADRQAIFLRLREAYRERDHLRRGGTLDRVATPLHALTDDLRRCIRACADRMAETHAPLTDYMTALEGDLLG